MTNSAKDRKGQADHLSYLLRLWRESEEQEVWRASLEAPQTGERTGFASLEALLVFLGQSTHGKEET